MVPRQRVQHGLGQVGHLLYYGVPRPLGAVPVRQAGRYREAGRALHEHPDRRLVGRAGDRVALPAAGFGAAPASAGRSPTMAIGVPGARRPSAPVRFETPAASAARAKLMPPDTISRRLALRASCISLSLS